MRGDAASRQTPASLGFSMPPEWHVHESTWLAWPKDPVTWPGRVPLVEEIFLRVISILLTFERVDLLVDDLETEEMVRRRIPVGLTSNLRCHRVVTVDSWIRDYGPNFLLRRTADGVDLAFNHWLFNAWGDKYEDLKRDGTVPSRLAPILGAPRFEPGVVLEGGSIEVNGAGVCLTTEQCLLNPNRNPHLSRQDLETYLREYLGAEQVVWLGEGIAGDDTDGHVDDIARFVNAETIVCAIEEDPSDENYELLKDNLRRLNGTKDHRGRKFDVVTIPMPGVVEGDSGRLPASYANFYIANNSVLVPTFGHANDAVALEVLSALFPSRSVRGIYCEPMVWGLGTLHCATQQQPARV